MRTIIAKYFLKYKEQLEGLNSNINKLKIQQEENIKL